MDATDAPSRRETNDGGRTAKSRKASLRTVAQLGGTTRATDIAAALALLPAPQRIDAARIAEFERTFADRIGVRHGFAFWAGRIGLFGVLRALGVGVGDEVLVQVPTHVVVANAIRFAGATPVFVDCEMQTFNVDPERLEASITSHTRAIVLQHTFGLPADPVGARELARRYGLALIEDCVHALGSRFDGRAVGSFGDAAFFSLEETKTISATMGGVVVTGDDVLAQHIGRFRDECPAPSASRTRRYLAKFAVYGVLTAPNVYPWSGPAYELAGRRSGLPRATSTDESRGVKPDVYLCGFGPAQAVIALRQLSRLDQNLAHRQIVADHYTRLLPQVGLRGPEIHPLAQPVFVRYPVLVPDRTRAIAMSARVAQLGTWFTSVVEESRSPADVGYVAGTCPVAEHVARHLVNLPTHPRTRLSDVEALVEVLGAF